MSSRFQQAETEGTAPLGAVIPKMAGRFHGVKPGRHSCPPAAQAIPESPEGLSSSSPRTEGADSFHPQAQPRRKKKCVPFQIRNSCIGERTCQGRLQKRAGPLRPQASSSFARGGSPLPGRAARFFRFLIILSSSSPLTFKAFHGMICLSRYGLLRRG